MSLGSFNLGGLDTKMKKVLENLFGTWLPSATMTMTNKTLTSPAVTGLTGSLTSPAVTGLTGSLTGPNMSDPVITGEVTSDEALEATWGAGLIGTGVAPTGFRRTENGVIITTFKIDLTGLTAKGTAADDCIGLKVGAADSHLCQYTVAAFGVVFKIEMSCIEKPAGCGTAYDLDLSGNAAKKEYDEAVGDICLNSGLTDAGQTAQSLSHGLTADHYVHLVEADTNGDDTVYTAGQFIIKFYGHPVLT